MKRNKSKNWVSPRHQAIKYFYGHLQKAGLNFDWDTAAKLYDIANRDFPRIRAKELPSKGTLERVEVIGFDEHGQKIVMEAAKPSWAQRRMKRKRWKTLFSQRTRKGAFNFMQLIRGKKFGIGYVGGNHYDFCYINPTIGEILGEMCNYTTRRKDV